MSLEPPQSRGQPVPRSVGREDCRDLKKRLCSRGALLCLLALTAACLAPFSNKAFFIDDTLFVRVAEQIQRNPADPFRGEINWSGTPKPLMHALWNPPLTSYYAALAAKLGGWSERTLHLAFIVPALFAVWGIFALAGRYSRLPLLAALIAIASPAFILSCTTIMCDIPMLALWVWGLVFFDKGLERRNSSAFLVSGLLISLAYLTKFIAAALVPLLVIFAFLKSIGPPPRSGLLAYIRRELPGLLWPLPRWLISLIIPLAVAAGYEWITARIYGEGHFRVSARYNHEGHAHTGPWDVLTTGLVFSGGCFLPLLLYAPIMWSRRVLLAGLCVFTFWLVLLPHTPRFAPFLFPKGRVDWGLSLQAALFATNGIQILCLPLADYFQRRRPESVLLLLWTFGIFFYAIAVYYTINGRGLLLLAPALVVLLARRCERLSAWSRPGAWLVLIPILPCLALSLVLVKADCNAAAADRSAALELCSRYCKPAQTVWFEGHWGFQYYMENLGAKPLDLQHPGLKPGDLLIMPNSAPNLVRPNPAATTLIDAISTLPNKHISTMDPSIGAGFYSDFRGPLPFAFGRPKPEYFLVFAPIQTR